MLFACNISFFAKFHGYSPISSKIFTEEVKGGERPRTDWRGIQKRSRNVAIPQSTILPLHVFPRYSFQTLK